MQARLRLVHLIAPENNSRLCSKADADADHTGPWAGQTPTMTSKTTLDVTAAISHSNFEQPIL